MAAPHDIHAEQAVLATLALWPEYAPEMRAVLPPERDPFADGRHNALYKAVLATAERSEEVRDWVILREELRFLGLLGQFRGDDDLRTLVDEICEKLPMQYQRAGKSLKAQRDSYVRIVQNAWAARVFTENSRQIVELLHTPGGTIEQAVQRMNAAVREAVAHSYHAPMQRYGDLAERLYVEASDRQQRYEEGGGMLGLSLPVPGLDAKVGGLPPGWVMLLGAPTGQGKSTLAMQLAGGIAASAQQRHGPGKGGAAVFSVEMLDRDLAGKVLYGDAGVDSMRVRAGTISADELQAIEVAAYNKRDLRLFIERCHAPTWPMIRARIMREYDNLGFEVAFVDYIQRIPAPRGMKKNEYYPEMMSEIHELAELLGIPIVCAAQLSREASKSKKPPTIQQLGDASALEKDSDIILLLHNRGGKLLSKDESEQHVEAAYTGADKPDSIDLVDIIVAKHRFGRTGTVSTHFNKTLGRFVMPPKPQVDDFQNADGSATRDFTEREPVTVFDMPPGNQGETEDTQ